MSFSLVRVRSSSPLPPVEGLGARFGSKPHTVAKAGTTDCVRAFRRAFDSQQKCRLD